MTWFRSTDRTCSISPQKTEADVDPAIRADGGIVGIGTARSSRRASCPTSRRGPASPLLASGTQKLPSRGSRPKPSGERKPELSTDRHGERAQRLTLEVHVHDDAREVVHVAEHVERVVRCERDVEEDQPGECGTVEVLDDRAGALVDQDRRRSSRRPRERRRSSRPTRDRAQHGRAVVVADELVGIGVDRLWPWRSSRWAGRRRPPGRA